MTNLNYGIIGNCRSSALVSSEGSIDWCCLPEFDSSSIFAKLLDDNIGGSFAIITDGSYAVTQNYLENTAILVTTFNNGTDAFEVSDFMPRYRKENGAYHSPPEIIRYVRKLSGLPVFSVRYDPKLEYALDATQSYVKDDFIISVTNTQKFDSLFLYSSFDKQAIVEGAAINLENDGFFLLGYNEKIFTPTTNKVILEFERTKTYWLNWSDRTTSYGR